MNTQHPQENVKDPQQIRECFQQGALKKLVEKAHLLMNLNQQLLEIVETEVCTHCQIMNLEGTTLTIAADSGAWATRLRYQSKEILALLKKNNPELLGITVVNVKVLLK